MLISGLNKLSLIDYPGHIACVVFTLGCNLRCGYCHNPDFVLPERIKNLKLSRNAENEFFTFLNTRKGLLEGVSITGGEPTIHRDLGSFCAKIKNLGYKVKLDTNGRYPEVLAGLMQDGLIDYIAMDIKHTWEKYAGLTGVTEDMTPYQESVSLIKNSGISYEFRTTLIAGIHTSDDIDTLGKILSGAEQYYLQRYRTGDTLDPHFSGRSPDARMFEEWKDVLFPKYVKNIDFRL